jgi:hypothetical protein
VSIVELQARARRLGEIRLGDKAPSGYPVSLDTFRLTSAAKGLLDRAAELWGGEVKPWEAKWQVVTEAKELPVIVPPQDPDNVTWYELWSQGGLQRRCDGEMMQDGDPCICDPDERVCSMVTRLSLMLPDMPDVGIWTLSSTGYYAASEMAMSIKIVMQAAQKTGMLPEATLAIDHREIKRPGEQLKKFVVPILRFADTLGSFIDVDGGVALPSGSHRHLPVGEAVEAETLGSVQHQPESPPAAQPIVATIVEDQGIKVTLADIVEDAEQRGRDEVLEAQVVDDEPLAEVVDHPTVDDAWSELLNILSEKPDEGTMGNVQDRTYRLYTFMHRAGMWGEHAREAALQLHYGTEHLTSLRKAELNEFAVKSFDAAKAAVTEDDDE